MLEHRLVHVLSEAHQPDIVDAGISPSDGRNCRSDGVVERPAVDAGTNERECDASSTEFVGDLERTAITGLQ